MSRYLHYDKQVARVHARDRPPVARDFAIDVVRRAARRANPISVLDAGCGTGSYADAVRMVATTVVALDASPSMLEAARTTLDASGGAGTVRLIRGRVEQLPFRAGTFSIVMLLQVLHHVERGDDPAFSATAGALAEAARVLRPEGYLLLSFCTHEQLRHGFWYYALIPDALERALSRAVPRGRLDEMLHELGFVVERRYVPDETMQGSAYFMAEGPLDADWRRTDSIWALASRDELNRAEERTRALMRQRRLGGFVEVHDAARRRYGQFTLLAARHMDGGDGLRSSSSMRRQPARGARSASDSASS